MTAVLCNKCSPFPPSSCSVRRRRTAVARRPSPPALSSRPPVRPVGNTVLPEYIVSSQKTTTLTCPTNDKKLRRRHRPPLLPGLRSTQIILFSRLYTCLVHDDTPAWYTTIHLPGQLRDTRTDNDRHIDRAANRLPSLTDFVGGLLAAIICGNLRPTTMMGYPHDRYPRGPGRWP
ncbi:Uncharacterized protein FWK35_00035098 [Aphis craccivora]|uniref:Uncharacterized protein n=1 Tax=Aphis craccivora TaxID=307492 RepID=A0A6G0VZ39_APHCR|nr:Uncharacterized protein FWK35_00035098 [Aphis craccivora]